jgi:hypothetical protein
VQKDPEPVEKVYVANTADVDVRLAALQAHPDWPRLQDFSPEDAGKASPFTAVFMGLFLVAWLAIGGSITVGFASMGLGPLVLFPLALVTFGAVAMVRGGLKYQRFLNSPIVPTPALVVDERIQVSGGGKNSSASTNYFTTLEVRGGKRTEHKTIEAAASQACPGDVGVAYLRANTLVHFERVRV